MKRAQNKRFRELLDALLMFVFLYIVETLLWSSARRQSHTDSPEEGECISESTFSRSLRSFESWSVEGCRTNSCSGPSRRGFDTTCFSMTSYASNVDVVYDQGHCGKALYFVVHCREMNSNDHYIQFLKTALELKVSQCDQHCWAETAWMATLKSAATIFLYGRWCEHVETLDLVEEVDFCCVERSIMNGLIIIETDAVRKEGSFSPVVEARRKFWPHFLSVRPGLQNTPLISSFWSVVCRSSYWVRTLQRTQFALNCNVCSCRTGCACSVQG